MTLHGERSLAISHEDSLLFAEASGDFNPLHLDPVAARRTQFGGTVVHGIHALLRALDVVSEQVGSPAWEPASLTATFNNPIRTGTTIVVRWAIDETQGRVRVTAEAETRPAFSAVVAIAAGPAGSFLPPVPSDAWSDSAPAELSFPPGSVHGETRLTADTARLARLFPSLHAKSGVAWAADVMATTRIVGMECPGLHSIYSGLKLRRIEDPLPGDATTMRFEVERLDERFRLARIRVRGSYFEGTLDTFFRPPPVQQPSLARAAERVQPAEFDGQVALVIGGSRGLGETAAKILLAGGAEVTITYASGNADAARVVEEARQLGRRCTSRRLDLTATGADATTDWLQTEKFTHAYFFASPRIEKNSSGHWNQDAFEQMSAFYVRGFAALVESLRKPAPAEAPLRWLYPSTVFLDTAEPGFAEYCAAKAAGEVLARHLSRIPGVTVSSPRLPRMQTDQTSGLVDVRMDDALEVLHQVLREFNS